MAFNIRAVCECVDLGARASLPAGLGLCPSSKGSRSRAHAGRDARAPRNALTRLASDVEASVAHILTVASRLLRQYEQSEK